MSYDLSVCHYRNSLPLEVSGVFDGRAAEVKVGFKLKFSEKVALHRYFCPQRQAYNADDVLARLAKTPEGLTRNALAERQAFLETKIALAFSESIDVANEQKRLVDSTDSDFEEILELAARAVVLQAQLDSLRAALDVVKAKRKEANLACLKVVAQDIRESTAKVRADVKQQQEAAEARLAKSSKADLDTMLRAHFLLEQLSKAKDPYQAAGDLLGVEIQAEFQDAQAKGPVSAWAS